MVFLFILLIIILLITSKIKIEISNFKFTSKKIKSSYLNDKYNIKIEFVILSKIPILWVNINKKKIQKLEESGKFKNININFKDVKKDISIKKIKQVQKQINIQIKKFNLKLELGTDSTILTSMIIPTISSIISIILARKRIEPSNSYLRIKPIYNKRKFTKS